MQAMEVETALRIDIGCGGKKREGFVGVDLKPYPGVDHVVDLMDEQLPFGDDSVDEVFSSHFLEHVAKPNKVLHEIVRVCKPGAKVNIFTPFVRHCSAHLGGHVAYFSELTWDHICLRHPDIHFGKLPGLLRLDAFHFVLSRDVEKWLNGIPLPVAIRYMYNIVFELKAELTVVKGPEYVDKTEFKKTVANPKCFVGSNRNDRRPIVGFPDFWLFNP